MELIEPRTSDPRRGRLNAFEGACRRVASDICREIVGDRKVHVTDNGIQYLKPAWFALPPDASEEELNVTTVTIETKNFLTQLPKFPFMVGDDEHNALAYVEAVMMQGVWFSRALPDHDQMLWRRAPTVSFDRSFDQDAVFIKPTMRFGLWRQSDFEAADKPS